MSSYHLIEAEKAGFPVQFMCRMLGVSKSGYYHWRDREPSRRSREDTVLTDRIREIHRCSRETYGSPRIHAELRSLGSRCSRKRVARLMREAGLRGCMRGRRNRTARRAKGAPPAEDLVKRNFAATEVDKVWVADITYGIATREGFLYLAFILDVHSRRVVGWAMEHHLRAELVVDALQMAVWRRKPELQAWSTIGIRESSTPRSHSGRGSGRWASSRRWEGPGPPWTTLWPSLSSRR